jgi:hypothetical protein
MGRGKGKGGFGDTREGAIKIEIGPCNNIACNIPVMPKRTRKNWVKTHRRVIVLWRDDRGLSARDIAVARREDMVCVCAGSVKVVHGS